jgi:glycosyltransferase involved in cell wall biosynthesis
MSESLESPGDKRRFAFYANRRNLHFEIADYSKDYDIIVATQSADLSIWSKYQRGQTKIIYDFIDSYLAINKNNVKGILRGLAKYVSGQSRYLKLNHWRALAEMCSRADAVICSTIEQKTDIKKFCSNTHIILDTHMGAVRSTKSDYRKNDPFRLVWEGLPENLGSLILLKPVIRNLSMHCPIEFHVITDSVRYNRYLGPFGKLDNLNAAKKIFQNVKFHEWSETDLADIVCSCDVAVIPLNLSDPFVSGKPENKLLLFWRMAMPVITSATPAYTRAMQAAGMNYVAKREIDWQEMLERMILDENARTRAGTMGKAYAESEHSEEKLLEKWDAVFYSLGWSI